MARRAVIAKKKKTVRAAPRIKRGSKIKDFDWTGAAEWDGKKFHEQRRLGIEFYYDNHKLADLLPTLWNWAAANGYKKTDITAMKAVPNSSINIHTAILVKCLSTGMPAVHEEWNNYWIDLPGTGDDPPKPTDQLIKEKLNLLIIEGKEILKQKKIDEKNSTLIYTPSIQERIKKQSYKHAEPIDDWLEGFVNNKKTFDLTSFDIQKHFEIKKVTQAHARHIKAMFEGQFEEFQLINQLPTPAKLKKLPEKEQDNFEQIKEGYAHLRKPDVQTYLQALEKVISSCDLIIESSKATRKPRVKKSVSAEKMVASIKYKIKDEKYMIASINPSELVGSTELWIFNTKTRKLGKYVAINPDPTGQKRPGSGLQIKGTTILGYDPNKSVQKTLRKPEEKLKEFREAGKIKLRKFLEEIPTTDTKLNGRINPDTLLLKVA